MEVQLLYQKANIESAGSIQENFKLAFLQNAEITLAGEFAKAAQVTGIKNHEHPTVRLCELVFGE